jgi:hypothetical protein
MKKKYIEPSVVAITIKPCQMICNSVNDITGLDGVTPGEGDFVGGESDARGAEFSDWEF